MIGGLLRLAKNNVKQPAVVLLHGAGGLGGPDSPVGEWARFLNETGYAAFLVDSWSGRGLQSLVTDTTRFSQMSRMHDVFGALQVLASHPLIDSGKIAVMGFSHGGPAALYSSLKRFESLYRSEARFAAHISVYGPCNTAYRADDEMTTPVLMLHGTGDNWVPSPPCNEYAARLTKAGKNVRYVEYRGASHAFDGPVAKEAVKVEQGMTVRKCALAENESGIVFDTATRQPFGPDDPCIERGPTVHYDEEATKKAHEEVKTFLAAIFAEK
jgi:dienelactone hydrolase